MYLYDVYLICHVLEIMASQIFSILTPHGGVNILMDIVLPYRESKTYSTKRAMLFS